MYSEAIDGAPLDGHVDPPVDAPLDATVDAPDDSSVDPTDAGICSSRTCPTGCCDPSGRCLSGQTLNACGTGGKACSDCAAIGFSSCNVALGQVCASETQACGRATCPEGCCAAIGDLTFCTAGTASARCGGGGGQCYDCSAQREECQPETRQCVNPTCGPQNCGGCCVGNTCVVGTDAIACGKQGNQCLNCAATNGACIADGQPNERTCTGPVACSPANCAGCCVGDRCVAGSSTGACGKAGQACVACGATESCSSGACVAPPACGPGNCAGCCVGRDVCLVGADATACGVGGQQCSNCTADNKTCQAGACRAPACGPANCAGCCTAAGDCALGFTSRACGSAGAACFDCVAGGSTCNTLGLPRVCANQGGTCPSAYPGCAPAVTTAVRPARQGLCNDVADLDAIQAACATGAETGSCLAAFAVLSATNAACGRCLSPFRVPFAQGTGLARCAAPFVDSTCNHATGCATDCADTSCNACPVGNVAQCKLSVSANGGQCSSFAQRPGCLLPTLVPGALCSPVTYPNFGGWLRAVGDHFCGNGP
jgi:hypothetical protein